MLKILDVGYIKGHQLELTFNNGEVYLIDLKNHLDGEVYQPLRNVSLFTQFGLINGALEWINGADFAPEFLYNLGIKQKTKTSSDA